MQKFNLNDRIEVIQDDILNQIEVIKSADVLILNNVFEFFLDPEQQKKIWQFLFENMQKEGCKIVTIPSLRDSISHLGLESKGNQWVKEKKLKYPADLNEEEQEDLELIHLYVLNKNKWTNRFHTQRSKSSSFFLLNELLFNTPHSIDWQTFKVADLLKIKKKRPCQTFCSARQIRFQIIFCFKRFWECWQTRVLLPMKT